MFQFFLKHIIALFHDSSNIFRIYVRSFKQHTVFVWNWWAWKVKLLLDKENCVFILYHIFQLVFYSYRVCRVRTDLGTALWITLHQSYTRTPLLSAPHISTLVLRAWQSRACWSVRFSSFKAKNCTSLARRLRNASPVFLLRMEGAS